MGIFDIFRQSDSNVGVTKYHTIPGSENVPLQAIDKVAFLAENKDTAISVYRHAGVRSRQAANVLRYMVHNNVTHVGGISVYTEDLARELREAYYGRLQ